VHAADIQDRDGAAPLLASIRLLFPWVRHVFADGGYAGEKLRSALTCLGRTPSRSSGDPMPRGVSTIGLPERETRSA
jgi:hypothetical protein